MNSIDTAQNIFRERTVWIGTLLGARLLLDIKLDITALCEFRQLPQDRVRHMDLILAVNVQTLWGKNMWLPSLADSRGSLWLGQSG